MKEQLRFYIVVLVMIALIILGFYLPVAFLLTGRAIYIILCIAAIILAIAQLKIRVINRESHKKTDLASVVIVILLTSMIAYNEGPKIYASFVGKVENDINIREYAPFEEDTKAVHLSEQSSLTLSENLPRLDGATALYLVYAAFARAVYPENEYDPWNSVVECSKTSRAYQNLLNDKVDIIFAAAPSKEHQGIAASKGLTFELTPIGHEAFVFFVNNKNPVENVTVNQIRDIYSGNISQWDQISEQNGEIIPFQRPPNSGSQTMLEKIMGDRKIMEPRKEDVVGGMGGIIQRTANYTNYKNSIGYSFLFFATQMAKNDQIKILAIDGIEANEQTIKNKTYPFSGTFYAVTIKEHESPENVDLLINWILSSQGQYIIEKTGYIPL